MIIKTWRTTAHTNPPNCSRCQAMNDQRADEDGRFTTDTGYKSTGSPLHPHCDCIVAYSNE